MIGFFLIYKLFFLDEAMPALLAAEQSLKSLNKNDIVEVRSMKRPPGGVVYVIESICIVKNVKPNKVQYTFKVKTYLESSGVIWDLMKRKSDTKKRHTYGYYSI